MFHFFEKINITKIVIKRLNISLRLNDYNQRQIVSTLAVSLSGIVFLESFSRIMFLGFDKMN